MAGNQNVTIRAPKAASIRAMTSAYGRVIPLIFGKARVQANAIYLTDFTAIEHKSKTHTGGKGGGGTQTNIDYTYNVCALFGLAEGVASASLGSVWVGKTKGSAASFGFSYFNGTDTQTALGYISTKHPTEALNYRGLVYLGAGQFNLGNDPSIPNINAEVIGRSSGVNVSSSAQGDANPADVVYDLITDARVCLGLDAASVGDLSAMRTFTQASQIHVSPAYTEAKAARELIATLCTIANTGVYFSEGIAKFVPYGDQVVTDGTTTYTPNLTAVYDLTPDHFLPMGDDLVKVTRKPQADAYNYVKVAYQNRANDYNDDIAPAQDQAAIEQFGIRLAPEVSLPEIADTLAARRVAQQILQRKCYIRNEYEFRLSWAFSRLEPMDILTLTEPTLGLDREPVRIIDIEEDEDGFLIKAEEMLVGVNGTARYSSAASTGYQTDYNIATSSTVVQAAFEPSTELCGTPQIWFAVAPSAVADPTWGGCNVWVSTDNETYKQVATIKGSSRAGVLVNPLAYSGSLLDTTSTARVDISHSGGTLDSANSVDAQALVTLCYADGEMFAYRDASLVSNGVYNLSYLYRGLYGTIPSIHTSNTPFARLDDSIFKFDFDPNAVSDLIFKFQSFNIYGAGFQDLSTVTPVVYSATIPPVSVVTGLVVDSSPDDDNISLHWNPINTAKYYEVQVRDATGTVTYKTVNTTDTRFNFLWQESANLSGGPYRNLRFYVLAVTANGVSSGYAYVSVTNPVPGALTGISVTGGYKAIFAQWNPNTSRDIAGYLVWMSTASGFTTGPSTLIYDGPDPKITTLTDAAGAALPAIATTYYLRAAAYDKFGKIGLNISSEFSTSTLSIASGISAGEITPIMIAAGALDMTKFASGIRPPRVVSTLPTIDGANYRNGDTVSLTTDGQLYRAVGGAWTTAVPAVNVTGTLTDAQLTAISAAKVTGTLTDSQLASISAPKITGQIVGTQITDGSITSPKILAGSVTTDKLLVTSGTALSINPDPNFLDSTAWTFTNVAQGINSSPALGSWGAVAPSYLSSTTVDASALSTGKFPITASKTYFLSANIYAASGNNRYVVLTVDFYNNVNSYISSINVFQGLPINMPFWAKSGSQFGFGTSNTIPAGAVYVKIKVIFQWSGIGSSSVQQAVQDFRLEEVVGGTLIQDGAITTIKIAANTITAGNIAAGTITATQIATDTITSANIAANAITASELSAGAVTTPKIAAGAVTANEIAANTITAGKIAAGAIGATEIAANAITADKLAVMAQGDNLVFNPGAESSTTGWAQSEGSGTIAAVTSNKYSGDYAFQLSAPNNSYGSRAFAVSSGEIYYLKVAIKGASATAGGLYIYLMTAPTRPANGVINNSLTGQVSVYLTSAFNAPISSSWTIFEGTITIPSSVNWASFAVANWTGGPTSLFFDAVECRKVIGGTLIQDGAITTNKIAVGTITADKIAANTITANQIAANTITGDRIAAATVTASNIDSRGLSIKDAIGNVILAAGSPLAAGNITPSSGWLNSNIAMNSNGTLSGAGGGAVTIGGLGYSGDLAATKNTVTYSSSGPSSPSNGDIWVDTSVNPNITRVRVSGAWQVSSNYVTNTNQVTDGAGLGSTAIWSNVSGSGKPADNATVGATIGTNLNGQMTGANISTFIAAAAINYALIGSVNAATISVGTLAADRIAAGSLDASKITANTITTDRLIIGSVNATVAANGAGSSLTLGASNSQLSASPALYPVSMTKTYVGSSMRGSLGLKFYFTTSASLTSGTYRVDMFCGGMGIDNGADSYYSPMYTTTIDECRTMYLVANTTYYVCTAPLEGSLVGSSATGTARLCVLTTAIYIKNASTGAAVNNSLAGGGLIAGAILQEIKV